MRAVMALAFKDLLVLARVRSAVFFTYLWPFLVAIMFGVIFAGPGRGSARIGIAVCDEDRTPASEDFAARLAESGNLDILRAERDEAAALVRRGSRTAAVVLPRGFGEAAQRMFYGTPPRVEVLIDPSRKAESAMIEGILFQQTARSMQRRLADRAASQAMIRKSLEDLNSARDIDPAERARITRFLGELDRFVGSSPREPQTSGAAGEWKPLEIVTTDTAREWSGPRNSFEVTFPQGILWGIIGCVMSFGISIVSERTHGTLQRLQIAPLTRSQLLAGKALACLVSITIVETALLALGGLFFQVRPSSLGLLAAACLAISVAFVGIMMLVSTLGRTEQAAAGAGWAVMLPMAMLGGGMMPLFLMPSWLQAASTISPVRWSLLALEGALWRRFSPQEMALPCAVLLALGIVCFLAGARAFRSDS